MIVFSQFFVFLSSAACTDQEEGCSGESLTKPSAGLLLAAGETELIDNVKVMQGQRTVANPTFYVPKPIFHVPKFHVCTFPKRCKHSVNTALNSELQDSAVMNSVQYQVSASTASLKGLQQKY